jgi:hypothetical protein
VELVVAPPPAPPPEPARPRPALRDGFADQAPARAYLDRGWWRQ